VSSEFKFEGSFEIDFNWNFYWTPVNIDQCHVKINLNLAFFHVKNFLEKVVLPEFKEFHGLEDGQKIIRKKVNPWLLSCTEKIHPKNGVLRKIIFLIEQKLNRKFWTNKFLFDLTFLIYFFTTVKISFFGIENIFLAFSYNRIVEQINAQKSWILFWQIVLTRPEIDSEWHFRFFISKFCNQEKKIRCLRKS